LAIENTEPKKRMEEIIKDLKASLEKLSELKPQSHHLSVAQAQLKSSIERLELDLKQSTPAAPAENVVPIAPAPSE
jgi:hypothetical protein